MLEALPGIVLGIEAGAPAFVAEGRIGDDVVLVLRSIHAAARFITARPEGGIEFPFMTIGCLSIDRNEENCARIKPNELPRILRELAAGEQGR